MLATYSSFKPITQVLLNSVTEKEEVANANALASLYQELLESVINSNSYGDTAPTHLDGGIALSSQHALDCLKDPLRTVRFIKSAYQALLESFNRFPNEKIELVYAGCGPAAPIIMPMLCLFKPEQVSITLLDINETSINSVSALINALGAKAFFRSIRLEDAIHYAHPPELPLHIVLSETMDKALTKEPQVRITQNLAPQLIDNGVFIPESIDIYTEHSFYSKEPYFDIYKNVLELEPPFLSRDKQLLFSISKDIQNQKEFEYTSVLIDVPSNFIDTPDICIYAEIKIFDNQCLKKSQSLISNPFCVTSLYNVKGQFYVLAYTTKGIPKWYCLTAI
ncbi:hypothetical protein H7U19_08070 [Hyunsoonleella sp. SJ7]|uniref:Phytanoyl-CoA dioxygenase n=1 Tax=Hyunsoonleella aquatilis TaxID=2762758 RepID=A0A923HFB5_9FLAO|nr:hypothetical protein [Hyunsoonleella aquatilis]MBC3758355.1 hypothetical protein [Hyunsoonleella aquatilis]